MNELGIIINQHGEYITFGTWVPIDIRSKNNDYYWHNTSFIAEVYNTEWFKNLGIPYNDAEIFTAQLDIFAKHQIITILNIKNNENSINEPALQLAAPENITNEQINTMNCFKEKLITWSQDNYSYIDIIDENGEYILPEINNINDYYEYLERKNKLHR